MRWVLQTFNKYKRQLATVLAVLVVIGLLAEFAFHIELVADTAFGLSAVLGVIPLIVKAINSLKFKVISIDLLVSIAVSGALVIQQFDEAGIVVFLFVLGEVIEDLTLKKTRSAIKELTDAAPKTAFQIASPTDRDEEAVDIDDIDAGDYLLVKTGGLVPVDGLIVDGSGHLNEANVNGESAPKRKGLGAEVFAGTTLTDGTIAIQATKVGEDTVFGKIIELVEQAQDTKTGAERFIDRFSKWYTPVVLLAAILVGVITAFTGTGNPGLTPLTLAITILVLGCPGALVIGVPVSNVAGIGLGARHGILAKGAEMLHLTNSVDTLVFDKTGTLTEGYPQVEKIRLAGGADSADSATDCATSDSATADSAASNSAAAVDSAAADPATSSDPVDAAAPAAPTDSAAQAAQMWQLVASLERESTHPLAQAIVKHYEAHLPQGQSAAYVPVGQTHVIAGAGVEAEVAGHAVRIGNDKLLTGISLPAAATIDSADWQHEALSIVYIVIDGQFAGMLGIGDALRPTAGAALTKLRSQGVKQLIMLSGDNQATASAIGQQLGLDEARGGMMPEDKAAYIKQLQANGHKVGFIGDGINDAPALTQADLGIAMGNGTQTAVEVSDIVLLNSDIAKLPAARSIAHATVVNTTQNIAIAIAVVVFLFSGLFLGFIYMWSGMLVHEGSILVVVLNALRLLRKKVDRRQ